MSILVYFKSPYFLNEKCASEMVGCLKRSKLVFFFFNSFYFFTPVSYTSVALCRSRLPIRQHGLHIKLEYILPVSIRADRVLISHVSFAVDG